MYKLVRIQVLILIAFVSLSATYALASRDSNFYPGGEGANKISGWAVSNIYYRLAEDPSKISAVEFDLDAPAIRVKASINSSKDAFFNCLNTSGTHWVCNTNQESISSADVFRVVALDK